MFKFTPNLLTLLRILLIPFIIFFIVDKRYTFALAIFLFCALTDYMDGLVARKFNTVTGVGTLLDPIADKMLTSSVLIALACVGLCDLYSVILIVVREQAVTGLRAMAASKGVIIPAERAGKLKTFMIVVSIALLLSGFREIGELMVIISAFIAFISGAGYFYRFLRGAYV